MQLDRHVQTHFLYPHPQSDVVQLNTPEYDPDIDGQPDTVTDIQSPNAKTIKEDTLPVTTNSEQHTALSSEPQLSLVFKDTDHPGYQDDMHPRAENPSDYHYQLEDIPELEDEEENGKKPNLQMLISLITTTLLGKVTEYVASTLHILRKLQTKNIILTIAQPKA